MSPVETERLLLGTPVPGDLDTLAAIFAKPEVWWFPLRRGLTRDETDAWIDRWAA